MLKLDQAVIWVRTMTRKNVAITGISGQLGRALKTLNPEGWEIHGVGSQQLDVTSWPNVKRWITDLSPDLVIHAAANTDVDGCERDPDQAFLVNAVGTRNVAQATELAGGRLCYISTNFVFDGESVNPYHEFDEPRPISVYGASKLAGEREALAACPDAMVIRTSMVYDATGRNFVNTMLRLMGERDELTVVADQTGNPTFAADLAQGIASLTDQGAPGGTYHMTNSGIASWYDWAIEIKRISGKSTTIRPISASEYKRDAAPPKNGTMTSLVLPQFGISLPDWHDAIDRCLKI